MQLCIVLHKNCFKQIFDHDNCHWIADMLLTDTLIFAENIKGQFPFVLKFVIFNLILPSKSFFFWETFSKHWIPSRVLVLKWKILNVKRWLALFLQNRTGWRNWLIVTVNNISRQTIKTLSSIQNIVTHFFYSSKAAVVSARSFLSVSREIFILKRLYRYHKTIAQPSNKDKSNNNRNTTDHIIMKGNAPASRDKCMSF